jgi:hypothetical protein
MQDLTVKITQHGPAAGLSWFITVAGIERGPFTRAQVLDLADVSMSIQVTAEAGAEAEAQRRAEAHRRDVAEAVERFGSLDNVPAWY